MSDSIDITKDENSEVKKMFKECTNEKKHDNVENPSHYVTGKFECIEVMAEVFGTEAVKNFCLCNAFKYLYRTNRKNGIEDLKKARWYINRYLKLSGEEEPETVDVSEILKNHTYGINIKTPKINSNVQIINHATKDDEFGVITDIIDIDETNDSKLYIVRTIEGVDLKLHRGDFKLI